MPPPFSSFCNLASKDYGYRIDYSSKHFPTFSLFPLINSSPSISQFLFLLSGYGFMSPFASPAASRRLPVSSHLPSAATASHSSRQKRSNPPKSSKLPTIRMASASVWVPKASSHAPSSRSHRSSSLGCDGSTYRSGIGKQWQVSKSGVLLTRRQEGAF